MFFSQSDEDEWVEDALEVLESEPYNLRCCYSQRDFVPGKPIISNIEDCITNSRCTVILFSPAFLDSEWCQIEHTLATTHTITKPGSVVVPIKLKPCELPISISTINYIDAAEGRVHEKIFNAVKSGMYMFCSSVLLIFGIRFLYTRHLTDVLWYGVFRLSVRPSVRM